MTTFLRNVLAVVLLQPGFFLDPHPRVLRRYAVVSILLSSWICSALAHERVIVYFVFGLLCMLSGPWPWARVYGGAGPWRTAFALAWCTPISAAASSLGGSIVLDVFTAGYLFLAITLQARLPAPTEAPLAEISHEERAHLRAAREALVAGHGEPLMALSRRGAVKLLEVGPVFARWQGFDIPDYLVDTHHQRWVFHDTTAFVDTEVLGDKQLLLPPGAVYRLA